MNAIWKLLGTPICLALVVVLMLFACGAGVALASIF